MSTNNNTQQILRLLLDCDLPYKDKVQLGEAFSGLPDTMLEPIVALLQDDIRHANVLSRNMKAKLVALARQDAELMERILREEEQLLDSIATSDKEA